MQSVKAGRKLLGALIRRVIEFYKHVGVILDSLLERLIGEGLNVLEPN